MRRRDFMAGMVLPIARPRRKHSGDVVLCFDKPVSDRIAEAFEEATLGTSKDDPGGIGLVAVHLDRHTAQQLLGSLVAGLRVPPKPEKPRT